MVQKEGVGEVELHAEPLLLVIESGEATLTAGGQKRAVAQGDVVLIPANLLHQMLVAPGKRITYRVIRQTSSEAAPTPEQFSGKKPALGIDLGSGFRACIAGENSPEGTIVDGYKKMVSNSFLGQSCIWKSESAPETLTNSSTGNKDRARPGAEVGQGYRGCLPGDDSPRGTVVDGYKKVSSASPFGVSCGWEKIK